MSGRPRKQIPYDDIKGLKTLLYKENKSIEEIAKYYEVSEKTIKRRIKEMEDDTKC